MTWFMNGQHTFFTVVVVWLYSINEDPIVECWHPCNFFLSKVRPFRRHLKNQNAKNLHAKRRLTIVLLSLELF